MKKDEKPKSENKNIWSRIKKVLKAKNVKGKDKIYYKQSVGFDLIDNNK